MASVKEDYDAAKAGSNQSAAIAKKISDLSDKINDIVRRALEYTNNIKSFVEDIEVNIFLPKLASNLSQEINNILRIKDNISKERDGIYSIELLKDVTTKIIGYLKDLSLCSVSVDEDNVVSHLAALQESSVNEDPFAYLDDDEVMALRNLMNSGKTNQFIALDKLRQDLEAQIVNLDTLRAQKNTLESTQLGGNDILIAKYEQSEKDITLLKDQESKMQAEIKKLENKIHHFDVQIQQEPDVKYDTLVKLKPLFEDIADTLLKKKKALIETEMQHQLNLLLISYKGHIGRVELSDSINNFNIKLYHTAGNEISLNQLNAASKQIFIQVLLKVLRNLGDYNPPVMIDTVMGVLDNESRDALMEEYFPQLAEQTILLCTTSEIRIDSDYVKLEPFVSKTYTLVRDVENQCTTVEDGYFGVPLNS